jgi:hypothetical protein
MARNKDWIPAKIALFDTFQNTFCVAIHANVVGWRITATKDAALQALKGTYDGFYAISKVKASAKADDFYNTKVARKALKKAIRTLTSQEVKNNTSISDLNRFDIGVPNAPAAKTAAQVMTVGPGLTYASKSNLSGNYKFTPRGLPDGQTGYRIKTGFYMVGTAIADIPTEEDCTQTDFITEAKDPINYPASKKGFLFISFTRYVNTDKKLGTDCTIYNGSV